MKNVSLPLCVCLLGLCAPGAVLAQPSLEGPDQRIRGVAVSVQGSLVDSFDTLGSDGHGPSSMEGNSGFGLAAEYTAPWGSRLRYGFGALLETSASDDEKLAFVSIPVTLGLGLVVSDRQELGIQLSAGPAFTWSDSGYTEQRGDLLQARGLRLGASISYVHRMNESWALTAEAGSGVTATEVTNGDDYTDGSLINHLTVHGRVGLLWSL